MHGYCVESGKIDNRYEVVDEHVEIKEVMYSLCRDDCVLVVGP